MTSKNNKNNTGRKNNISTLIYFLTIPSFLQLSQATTRTTSSCCFSHKSSPPTPIDGSKHWPDRFPAKDHCSRCGLCETSFVSRVVDSCAFLGEGMKRMDRMEPIVHGRSRRRHGQTNVKSNNSSSSSTGDDVVAAVADESRFGVMERPMMLARGVNVPGSQWTGCVTGIAVSMLRSKTVDAVVCIASKETSSSSWSEPEPIIAKTVDQVLRGRGVKPALAPSLKVLDDIKADKSIKRLLFCGVGCAVQAFRAIQDDLGLEEVYVLGTNCADNSPTPEAARNFMKEGLGVNESDVQGYEFMQDFRVHVKMNPNANTNKSSTETSQLKNSYTKIPYFSLPGSVAKSAIAPSCLACFDYTNGLADIVVGYMGAPLTNDGVMGDSLQTITVRNGRGGRMLQTAIEAEMIEMVDVATGTGSHEKISLATVRSDNIVLEMTDGDVKETGMPRFLGGIMAGIMQRVGPKGVSFARYSIDYHLLRNYLYVLNEWGENRVVDLLPRYAEDIVDEYMRNKSFADLRRKILAKQNKR